jgi:Rps23 Pro-64 3,4-dihydroxylase Tpa1-like proline 4-hydroxylase
VIDGFLGTEAAGHLLEQLIVARPRFVPSEVRQASGSATQPSIRSSLRLPGRVGVDLTPFHEEIALREAELIAAVGVQPFAVWHRECSIVSHGDGDFYAPHIDTRTRSETAEKSVRVVSCVYYLHREPAGFTGGELVIQGIVGNPGARIEPRHDRLVIFPSFLPHAVATIACPSRQFEDSRFNINCWLRRELPG